MKRRSRILAELALFIGLLIARPIAAQAEENIFGTISDEELLDLFLIRAVGATDTRDLNSFNTAILLKWDRPPRFRVISADQDLAGLFIDEVVRPLLVTFTNNTDMTATVSKDDAGANILTIIGEDPVADVERFRGALLQVMGGDQAALDKLEASLRQKPLNCFAKPGLGEFKINYAIIYVPQPKSAMFASAKCFGVSAARALGFLGPDKETDTVRNRTDPAVSFTPSDQAVLRILYDRRVLPRMTLEDLTAIIQDLNRKLGTPQ